MVLVSGWLQVIACLGCFKFSGGFDDCKTGTLRDHGFTAWTTDDPEKRIKTLSAEITNCRLARVAIARLLFQDSLSGSARGDWSLYADSSLRAFESELCMQTPCIFARVSLCCRFPKASTEAAIAITRWRDTSAPFELPSSLVSLTSSSCFCASFYFFMTASQI